MNGGTTTEDDPVIDGRVVTPPLERGVLPGVTRAFVLQALRDEEELVEERPIRSAEVDGASELFLTSSLIGARALRFVDGGPLPPASPVAESLAAAYARIP